MVPIDADDLAAHAGSDLAKLMLLVRPSLLGGRASKMVRFAGFSATLFRGVFSYTLAWLVVKLVPQRPRDGLRDLRGIPPDSPRRYRRTYYLGSAQRRRNGSSVTCRDRIRDHDPLVASVTRSSSLASRAAAASSRGGFSRVTIKEDGRS